MLMKSRIQLLLVFVIFCCTTAMAQIQVKGTVVSANDSEPMIGVAIREEGTTNSCITDLDGNYTIRVQNSNATLTVSFVGFKTQTIKVNGREKIDIRMQEDLKTLDEVVVVGYGVQQVLYFVCNYVDNQIYAEQGKGKCSQNDTRIVLPMNEEK